MIRGPLYNDGYRPQLSGHETFPLRHGWLKKAYDALSEAEGPEEKRAVFTAEDAIARFGVGKNMVASMRYWATAAGIIREDSARQELEPTKLGRLLFDGTEGLDPYMEAPATSWLAHWNVSGDPGRTTWFWSFSHFPALAFERDTLVRGVANLAEERAWPRASIATIRRDVACVVRTYVRQTASTSGGYEDSLESPLAELGLIKRVGRRDGFRFVRGPKPSLGVGVLGYAVTDFWERFSGNSNTLSFEALAHEPGSPGRVFVLGEDDLVELLGALEVATDGRYLWSETAGLKQLIRTRPLASEEKFDLLRSDYESVAA